MDKHKMANEYKVLCAEADVMSKKINKGNTTQNGWQVVDNAFDRKSNFKGVLYEKDGQYALCFVGTDKRSLKDWGANLKMGLMGNSKQMDRAKSFTTDMIKTYDLNPNNTVSIGHSEGGTEATAVGLENGIKTVTFNAFGVWESKYKNSDTSLVTNYRDPYDPVSKLHENVGTTYIVKGNHFLNPFGTVRAHAVSKMGDCENAQSVKEYKENHKWFINKLSDAAISREDIKKMEPQVFSLFEKEIYKRVANNQIKEKSNYVTDKNGKWVTINGNHVLIS